MPVLVTKISINCSKNDRFIYLYVLTKYEQK
ncbi:MAG: hypothetical protein [Siphoviridae sp. ctjeG17]|nr:MAG: hypothetical protein [Siphoviridae sp. ctjeG17]